MANKKPEDMPEALAEAEPETPKAAPKAGPILCGHVNKHNYNADGELEDLACTLPLGHAGDHSAEYVKNVGEPQHDEKGRVVKVVYHQEKAVAYWGDAAGKPADEIGEGEVAQMSLMQKDLVMGLLAKNPALKVDQAVAQARGLPAWNSLDDAS